MSQLPKPKKPKAPELPEEPKLPDLPEALTRSILTEFIPRSEYPCYYRVRLVHDKNKTYEEGFEVAKKYEAIINLELNQRLETGFKNYVLRRFENTIDIFKNNTFGRANLDTNHCYVSNFRNMGLYQSITFAYIERYWMGDYDRSLYHLQQKMDDLMVDVLVNCFSDPDTPLVPLNQATMINFRQHYKIKERHDANHISYGLWDDVVERGKREKAKKIYPFILINNKQLPLSKKDDIMSQLIKF